MPEHTTNYADTFIAIAPDSTATTGIVPPMKEGNPSIAWRTWQQIAQHPYAYTSDDVIFAVYADRNAILPEDRPAARERFFAKGQPCLRASDLGKRYGWGIHHNAESRVALYAVDSPEYALFSAGKDVLGSGSVIVKNAMRSVR